MAIFYNYIKGCGELATVAAKPLTTSQSKIDTTDSWSFLKWCDKLFYTKGSAADFKYFENNPIISFNNQPHLIATDADSDPYSTGRILTSAARGQYIYYDLSFRSYSTSDYSSFQQNEHSFYLHTKDWTINDISKPVSNNEFWTAVHLYGNHTKNPRFQINYPLEVNDKVDISGGITVETGGITVGTGRLTVGTTWTSPAWMDLSTTGGNIEFGCAKVAVYGQCDFGSRQVGDKWYSTLTIPHYNASDTAQEIIAQRAIRVDHGYVKAPYFNATSDARAKENIRKADFSALSIVNSLPVYNFNYKDSNKPSIGIIAQEAAKFNIDDFSLVENIEATGENGDYMSIKESKLIYVLMKAVQEQQEQIEKLQAEIKQLKA